MKTLYLAGPITGESWKTATQWRDYVTETLHEFNIQCLSPLRGKDYLNQERRIAMSYDTPLSTPKGIVTRDRNDVMTCDAIMVNLLSTRKVSIGTVMEIAWADMNRKPIILMIEDGNCHDHAMIREVAGYIVHDLEDAIDIAITALS